ncbi:MAG: Alpha/beta hydrolase family protein [Planctomycetes bacterium ADurb.Bin126]|nr:MAG: Alpha/beta hydrolase family protein [Planctomycetes bacterium ADurb.Bin126]
MKRTAYFVLFSVVLVAGCQNQDYARHVLVPDRTVGKLASTLCGSGEYVLKQKRIDSVGRMKLADGAELDVWVVRARKEPVQGTVLLLHAMGESKACYLPLGERLAGRGFDVALIDLRAHGESGGKYCTFGAREAGEVKLVADTLLEGKSVRPPLYAFGPGLGGSVAIQYAALDSRCKGVMALTPYKDFRSAGRRMLFPIAPAMSNEHFKEIVVEAGKMGQFDPDQASAVAAAAKLKCPLLLVHGWFDLAVPMEDSQEILKAAPGPKKLIDITPVLEQILLQATRDQWVADQLDKLAREGLPEK